MIHRRPGSKSSHLGVLWTTGTMTGLSDAQLLSRFVQARDSTGELAFRELILRHGPMVLAVCRQVLRHSHDVDDAFQATFLVLVRRAHSLRVGESVGPWLCSVAHRDGGAGKGCRVALSPWERGTTSERGKTSRGSRSVQSRSPAFALRGTWSAPGPVQGSHRTLSPRGEDSRASRSTAGLAGRHAQRPLVARQAALAGTAGTPRSAGTFGSLECTLAERPAIARVYASCRVCTASRGAVLRGANRFAFRPDSDSWSIENHVSSQTYNGRRCFAFRCDFGRGHRGRTSALHFDWRPFSGGQAGSRLLRKRGGRTCSQPESHASAQPANPD